MCRNSPTHILKLCYNYYNSLIYDNLEYKVTLLCCNISLYIINDNMYRIKVRVLNFHHTRTKCENNAKLTVK